LGWDGTLWHTQSEIYFFSKSFHQTSDRKYAFSVTPKFLGCVPHGINSVFFAFWVTGTADKQFTIPTTPNFKLLVREPSGDKFHCPVQMVWPMPAYHLPLRLPKTQFLHYAVVALVCRARQKIEDFNKKFGITRHV